MVGRDMSKPYSDAEISQVEKVFKSIASYNGEDGTVALNELPTVLKAMRYDRNSAQVKAYVDWSISYANGLLYWKNVRNFMKNMHKSGSFMTVFAQICDKDGNGYISADEFKDILSLMIAQDPTLAERNISFEAFVREADTNKDGKVSIPECSQWIEMKSNK